ncbi:hypothetical protein JRO89_XSUnG0219600 [Xanthoceras sorbifolium]|uniref:Disease resistance N-terminal domain-containing protein n=1 Tax=Xanthoceras sorbifolium TaxID=99658 RepID=A0ABQ8GWZ4_9ROSI|nr:hypothetical protein JRO89_XSUnG0219600 [Xanthoceras sorbifolium]
MADALFQFMLEKLDSLIQKEIGLIWGVHGEMEKLQSLLSTIQAVLEDAEEKQIKEKALRDWLRKLKAAAYKVDDTLDECTTEAALRMRDIRERLDEIAEERLKFHLIEGGAERHSDVIANRQTGSVLTQS